MDEPGKVRKAVGKSVTMDGQGVDLDDTILETFNNSDDELTITSITAPQRGPSTGGWM